MSGFVWGLFVLEAPCVPIEVFEPPVCVRPKTWRQQRRTSGGAVWALREQQREKFDAAPDAFFYSTPRFVRHADDSWHQRLTALYAERLPRKQGSVLDLMSSWVSHYPKDIEFERVAATGMNREELVSNPVLTEFHVCDFNADPHLPFDSGSFDAVTCALSVQYLQKPDQVFSDIARVLRPRGVLIISFSNRMFFTKAIRAWRQRSGRGRVRLVKQYLAETGAFSEPEVVQQTSLLTPFAAPLATLGLSYGGDPFYAVVAYKYHAPSQEEREQMQSDALKWVYATGRDPKTLSP